MREIWLIGLLLTIIWGSVRGHESTFDAESAVRVQAVSAIAAESAEASVMRGERIADRDSPARREREANEDADESEPCLPSGEIVRAFGWLEEGGVWHYHTGVDIACRENIVCAARGGKVVRIEQTVDGYRVELERADECWQYEPLSVLCVQADMTVKQGAPLGQVADVVHIARRCGDRWHAITAADDKSETGR